MFRSFAIILFLMIYTIAGFSVPLDCCEKGVSIQIKKSEMPSCHKGAHSKEKENKHRECPLKFCCLSYFSPTVDSNKIQGPCLSFSTSFVGHQNLIPQSFVGQILRPPIFLES